MDKKYLRIPLIIFDFFLTLLFAVIILILFTGGKIFYIGTARVSLQGVENPLTFLYFLIVFRYLLDPKTPFLGIPSFKLNDIANDCFKLCRNLYLKLSSLRSTSVYRIVIIIIGISLIIKIFNAYYFYGFFSGDDVEIHEMTFAHLFDWDTKAWNLRSPFFPMVFIFPIQATLLALGVCDPFYLIFAGRMIIILFSVLNLYLVFIIASRLFNSRPIGLLSMFFFALSKLHTTMGSSELPRTIASTFVILSFWFMLNKRNQRIIIPIAGLVLAIGASIRFSEFVLIVPTFLYLVFNKRLRQAILLTVFFFISFALINFISDQLYWGRPFFSLKNIVDYTIVKRQSTRGFQPLLYFILGIGLWSNYFSFGFMLLSLRQNLHKIWIWVATPIFILSLLPHKEPRFLLPVIPFFCIMVGFSVWILLEKVYHNDFKLKIQKEISKPVIVLLTILVGIVFLAHKDPRFSYLVFLLLGLIIFVNLFQKWRKRKRRVASSYRIVGVSNVSALLIFALLGIIIFEVNGFFFRRSESGVEMARFLYNQPDKRGVLVEDIWRAGGRLYLYQKQSLKNIDQTLIGNRNSLISSIMEGSVGWVGIRDKAIKQYGYDALLNDLGFKEVKFSNKIRLETYRLFKKESNNLEN